MQARPGAQRVWRSRYSPYMPESPPIASPIRPGRCAKLSAPASPTDGLSSTETPIPVAVVSAAVRVHAMHMDWEPRAAAGRHREERSRSPVDYRREEKAVWRSGRPLAGGGMEKE